MGFSIAHIREAFMPEVVVPAAAGRKQKPGASSLAQERSIRLSDEERAELISDNTRKLYMAIARAGQRLVITYVGPLPDILMRPARH